jgi:hypothetical protein
MSNSYIDITKAIQYGAITGKLKEPFFIGASKFYAKILGEAFKKQQDTIIKNLIPTFSLYQTMLQSKVKESHDEQ